MSILSSLRYCLGSPSDFGPMWLALGFMPFGLFFDFMDGKVARWRHKSSLMGQELDSLADLVSEIFCPCFFPCFFPGFFPCFFPMDDEIDIYILWSLDFCLSVFLSF